MHASTELVCGCVRAHTHARRRWLEDEWQLDLEGMDQEAVDENGWVALHRPCAALLFMGCRIACVVL